MGFYGSVIAFSGTFLKNNIKDDNTTDSDIGTSAVVSKFPEMAKSLLVQTFLEHIIPPRPVIKVASAASSDTSDNSATHLWGSNFIRGTDLLGDTLWDKLGKLCHASVHEIALLGGPNGNLTVSDYHKRVVRKLFYLLTTPALHHYHGISIKSEAFTLETLENILPLPVFCRLLGILHLNSFSLPVSVNSICKIIVPARFMAK